MANIISLLGAGSGLDTANLVSQLVEAERAPTQNRLDSKQETLQAQISAYGTLKSAMSGFQDVISPLANNDTFNARSVAFPDTDVITPNSLAAGAQTGTYQIEVVDVARAQSLAMGATADQNAAIGATGELSIQFGQWSYNVADEPDSFQVNDDRAALSIEVDASDSLQSIAEKINASDSGIQASVLRVDDQYQLMLTAPSGADNALQISASDASLADFEFTAANFSGVTETQQASDAELKVNGLSVKRDSNTIDDVIAGFDFTLNKSSAGEKITFSVDADKAVAEQAIRDFVEAYNTLYETAGNLTGYSTDEDNNTVKGDLSTDATAKTVMRQLRSMIGATVPGIESGFTALANLGIRTELDGTLSINETEFESALSGNFELVETLFARKTSSSNSYVEVGVGTRASSTVAGSYDVLITQDPAKGLVGGNSVTATGFDAGSDAFVPSLDTSPGDYSFKIKVNGTESDTISLTGTYSTVEELRAELQSLINGDAKLAGARAAVDVSYDSGTDAFTFTSRDYGSSSKVSFSLAGADIGQLGIDTALTGTAGKDVAGTINGVAGFGAGEVLLPDLSSGAYGLNLSISPGAAAQGAFEIGFSRGFAGGMNNLINEFLASSGPIASRETSLNDRLDDISDDREDLDRRIEKYEARLSAQFLAMEQIISSLNSTGDSLEGILDRLPYTAKD
ncbi:flagellar filament capping protein FliD [Marinobacterium rhizophilum]|uniref:Flagellar hook-associated protein 2 n=1 Tax=Marinobacterium rhizophilum TaxID=420402 RepID=A0ABY5HCG7_9GAMM|nr:flagellar filament capping protein FliD [Marinobacterium rhizophilum]UTW10047.1 flagellar filament capping protein FliD [Marinobacterium rhizophilum]